MLPIGGAAWIPFAIGALFAGLCYCAALMLGLRLNANRLRLQRRIERLAERPDSAPTIRRAGKARPHPSFGGSDTPFRRLEQQLSVAGVPLRAKEFVLIWAITGIGFPALAYVASRNVVITAAVTLCGLALPPLLPGWYKRKRMRLFDSQLSDSLMVISNCLRAGFTFQQALESIVSEMPDPISAEFGRVLRETKLNVPLDTALQNMVQRLKSDDLGLLVSAVIIQRQVGGNLAEILDNISGTIRDRLKIRAQIKVATSSGRASGLIIGLLPVIMLLVLMLIDPSYVNLFFTTPTGIAMLCVGGVLELIGFLFVRKIVNIKF